jgi:probable HAF family extracellular repeat protein
MSAKVKTWKCAAAAMLLVAVTMPLQLAAQQTHYVVKDLGTLGGKGAVAEGISDRGWVVGSANLAGDQNGHAFLWRDGIMTDLGTLGGQNSQEQWPVKDKRGLIVGSAETPTPDPLNEDFCGFDANSGVPPTGLICLGFLWQEGVMTPLPTLGGNNAQAVGVNDLGQVVGFAEESTQYQNCSPPQTLDIQAVVWGPNWGEIRTLAPLPGDVSAWAIGINNYGQIIGVSGQCVSPNFNTPGATTPQHAVIWQRGTVRSIGNLGGSSAFPWAINSNGQVVGQSWTTGDQTIDAFLWQGGVMSNLGAVPGDFGSFAFSLNDLGQVVGTSCSESFTCRAFLWQKGLMVDVNTLVIGSTSLYLVNGNDINSRGEIAAYGFDQSSGEFHAALAIPCDREHADTEGCAESSQDGTAAVIGNAGPAVVLPQNVREQLRRRLGFGRFASGPNRL